MVPAAIIARKRDGHELSAEEIEAMIRGFLDGGVADYQMAAFAMAIVCRGMTSRETAVLTSAMLGSGVRLQRVTGRLRVDKHSTGGLGDSTSLILAPLLACLGFDVPMLSGRGLGITGGTLDKLEAIAGYRCDLTTAEIDSQLQRVGCVITGTTPDITPADRRLYALRDVTATVESIPLITASIMSKKLAETLDALVLDVKFGSGAFMLECAQAASLAHSLVAIGQASQLPTRVLLTSMDQPLGRMVGNACEVNEALEVLEGETRSPLARVTLGLCGELLLASDKASDAAQADQLLQNELASGRPLRRFQQMVEAQSGQWRDRWPTAPAQPVLAEQAGYVSRINGRHLGNAIIELGGGRKALGDPIDHSVGLEMLVRLGDAVMPGQPLVTIMAQRGPALEIARRLVQQAITIGPDRVSQQPLIRSL